MRLLPLGALLLAGCATTMPSLPLSTAVVTAAAETDPVASTDDAADDPAIWRNPADPAASLIVATDKRAGLHLYDLSGHRLDFAPSPRLNNVDLRTVTIRGVPTVLVAASDRADIASAAMRLFRLDTVARRLVPLGAVPSGPGEAYGMCLWQRARDRALFGFVVLKDGRIDQLAFDLGGPVPTAIRVRTLKLATQSEGCVADDRTGLLYVAEEDVGLWRFAADPAAPATATAVAPADGRMLVADAEGLAIVPQGRRGGYLVASSQGDSAYAVYRLPGMAPLGRFRIGDGPVDAVSETDGLDIAPGSFGPAFAEGLMVVQDGDNAPATQNFKLVPWDRVRRALGLR